MSMSLVQTFEVTVVVTPKGQTPKLCYDVGRGLPAYTRDGKRNGQTMTYQKDKLVMETETRMYHIEAKTHDQAFEKGKKYGRPVSARKVKLDEIAGDIEHLKLNQKPYGSDNVFINPVAMDDMIWMKKAKRSERIADQEKDKK